MKLLDNTINYLESILNERRYTMSEKAEILKIYRLSPLQEGMLFHSIKDLERKDYIQQLIITVEGNLNVKAFEETFKELVRRYDIFRTNFIYGITEVPQQVVLKHRNISISYVDITNLEQNTKLEYICDFIDCDKKRGFDLSRDILMRIHILKYETNIHKIVWSFHHILLDGWSSDILLKEFLDIYSSIDKNIPLNLDKPHQYIEYINWIKKMDESASETFWKNYLMGYSNKIIIPEKQDFNNGFYKSILNFMFDDKLKQELEEVAKRNSTTISIILQALWGIILQKYNNQDDIVFGLVISGRNSEIAHVENILGLFINTIPIRVTIFEGLTFAGLIKSLNENLIQRSKHEYYPLAKIQSKMKIKNDLINHVMILHNHVNAFKTQANDEYMKNDLYIKDVELYQQTSYNFTLEVLYGNTIEIKVTYNACLYNEDTLQCILNQFESLAKIVVGNPEIFIDDINIISKEEEENLLAAFNEVL